MPSLRPESPRPAGRRLTRLLARWADVHRLSDQQSETIRRQIVASPAASDFERWWRLLDPVNGTAFRSSRARAHLDIAAPSRPVVQPAAPGWPQDEPGFQLYVRL